MFAISDWLVGPIHIRAESLAWPQSQRDASIVVRLSVVIIKRAVVALDLAIEPMPLGHEVFAGNTAAVTTSEHVVETMERRYGKSDRIWVMDRGIVSEDNIQLAALFTSSTSPQPETMPRT